MAITTQLVGKLGGGAVEKIDINFADRNDKGIYDVVTVPIPNGVPHIILLNMKTIETSGTLSVPEIYFGTVNKGAYSNSLGLFSAGGVYSTPVTIKAKKNAAGSNYSVGFTGTVYYAPIGN